MKKFLIFTIIFSILFSSMTYATEDKEELTFKEFEMRIRKEYFDRTGGKTFEMPIPQFTATIKNGEKYTVKPFRLPYAVGGDIVPVATVHEKYQTIPISYTVPVGTDISLDSAITQLGSGNKILGRDWQIYYSDGVDPYLTQLITTGTQKVDLKVDKKGFYYVFLNVADNFKVLDLDYENWSGAGNWRGTTVNANILGGSNLVVTDWYFTTLGFEVGSMLDFTLKELGQPTQLDDKTIFKVNANLVFSEVEDEIVDTKIEFYSETGVLLDSKDISFNKNKMDNLINFEVNDIDLVEGVNIYYAVINSDFNLTKSDPEIREKVINNNKLKLQVVKGKADFSVNAMNNNIIAYKGEGNPSINAIGLLLSSNIDINSQINLYKEGILIKSESSLYKTGSSMLVNFAIQEKDLKIGENKFSLVINSDYNLTKGIPFDEKDLSNNKVEVIINYKDKTTNSLACSFKGNANNETYINKKLVPKTCSDYYYDIHGDRVDYDYDCSYYICDITNPQTYNLKRESEVSFLKQGIFSNDWHRMAIKDINKNIFIGQEYGRKHGLPFGKDLNGNDATNELMTVLGFNPLRQVIQAGAGIQIKTNIKITGYVENFDKYIDEIVIQNYIDDFRNISTNVSGKTTSKLIKNNNGVLLQKMEYDSARGSEYTKSIIPLGFEEIGNKDCKTVKVYKTKFEYELPMIITNAEGTIDVIGGKKAKVPTEKRWFVYLNDLDGIYQLGLQTTLKPSLLGVGLPNTDCIDSPPNYKIGINGTIFDNTNVEDGGGGFWDN